VISPVRRKCRDVRQDVDATEGFFSQIGFERQTMKIRIEVEVPDAELQEFLIGVVRAFSVTPLVVGAGTSAPAESVPASASSEPERTAGASTAVDTASESDSAEVTLEEVLKRAEEFMKAQKDGPSKLRTILAKVDPKVGRVRDLSKEKLPELLALLAVE